jgi:hypothetical protein
MSVVESLSGPSRHTQDSKDGGVPATSAMRLPPEPGKAAHTAWSRVLR